MKSLLEYKVVTDDFEVHYDATPMYDVTDSREQLIINQLRTIDKRLANNQDKIDALNNDIDRLTNHADGIDYMVAVGSGIIAGLVDSFWVGEFSLERGKEWSSEKVNNFVKNIAKSKGYEGDDLQDAIKYLEDQFPAPSDSVTGDFGGGLQHHLRDFAHHPTPIGLGFSMLTQFTSKAYGTDKNGFFMVKEIENKAFIGEDIKQKFLFGTIYWMFHIVSDMAGSSTNPGAGTGLPGPIISLLKELSSLPVFNSLNKDGVKEFSLWISKLFNGTLLAERDEDGKIIQGMERRLDLRAEIGVIHELGRQALPVILNECIVRGFYFIRRLAAEIKEKDIKKINELKRIDWHKVKPANNRTITRMLTIATGTFTLVDMADAAIRGAVKSGGNSYLLAKEFIMRVNFIGIGRFAIAVGYDTAMGIEKSNLRNERIAIFSEQLHLMNAKVYYLQANTWIAAETTARTINEALEMMERTILILNKSFKKIDTDMKIVVKDIDDVKKTNPRLIENMIEAFKWG